MDIKHTLNARAALTLGDEHTGEYGTGMMIMHWRVAEGWWWERAWAARAA